MATSASERLTRVLQLEERQRWRNRAVIGGIHAMSENWQATARAEGLDGAIISACGALMAQYADTVPDARPLIVAKMRQALSGDLTDLDIGEPEDDLLSNIIEELVQAEPAPVKSDRIKSGKSGRKVAKPARHMTPSKPPEERIPDPFEEAGALADMVSDWVDMADDGPSSYHPTSAYISPPEPTDVARERVRKQRAVEPARDPHELQEPPTVLPGIGQARAAQLEKLGIHQVIDLFWHLPARHEDYSQQKTIAELQTGEQVTVLANLWEIRERKISMSRQMVQGILSDGTGTIHATWWNKYIARQLKKGVPMRFSGKVGLYMGQKTLDNPAFEEVDEEEVATGRMSPVYRLTEGITNQWLRGQIKNTLDRYIHFISDPLPRYIRREYELMELDESLRQVHYPDGPEQLKAALHRLSFEELFYVQLGVQQRRHWLQQAEGRSFPDDPALLTQFKAALPFTMTHAQQRVLDEIAQDMTRSIPMTRLIQGDVGSGKTAVAAGAMWLAAANGTQSALLAPTQILAEQHYRGISELLAQFQRNGTPLNVALLTGRVTGTEREDVLAGLEDGTIDVVIGTTALIQEPVLFNDLAFAVIDEQHRFGVAQRGRLRSKNRAQQPHLLVMSATPIPRSLALTVFGDLDVSIIDEMPPGRVPVKTKWFHPKERERLYGFMRREAREGRQAFIIYPLVEESEKLNAGAAVDEHARLSQQVFPNLRLGLLHGRMSGAEKDTVMQAFANREYDALVSTSVIEVGIDIPNASLIVIEDAERFGLAQLHQFRGRVGRGQHQSYCALVSQAENEEATERLNALAATNDGFALAEKDLELRGPGDFLGTRQSGLPDLRIAHLSDLATVAKARDAARVLFAQDPELENHPQLKRQIGRFWRGHGDVS